MQDSVRCLYICYLSLADPLVHSQVVAYLGGLAERGHVVHLLTFDTPLDPGLRRNLNEQLERRGVVWHSRRYHKAPSLPATAFDTLAGAFAAMRIMRNHRLTTIHARNHVPAAMALIVKRLTGCRMIFDLRGLMAEEYVDAGNWKRDGLPYRLTQRVQRAAIRRADGMVVLTDAVKRHIFDGRRPEIPLSVIPCCADVASMVGRSPDTEAGVRAELHAGERPIMIYVGKFTGWYLHDEMVDFHAAARQLDPELLFVVLSQSDPEIIEREFARAGIGGDDFRITRAEPADVGRYLQAADYGISFVRPCFSKISSSPTKVGEYLAAGLPVVSTAGIGDVDELLERNRVGVVVRELSPSAYEVAAREALELARDPGTRERCRAAARERLSLAHVGIPRYDELYRKVAALR
jgi:glycosyltransferase involved in cell wall biosynthesis